MGQGSVDPETATCQQALEFGRCKEFVSFSSCLLPSLTICSPIVLQLCIHALQSQNTVLQLAKDTGDIDLFELKDELAYNLQMCDQLTYDNAFVYFQPGNGKFKIKEPQELAKKAMAQLDEIISIVNGSWGIESAS